MGCGIPGSYNALYLDGTRQGAPTQILSADGWRQITRHYRVNPRAYVGYDNILHQIFATPGTVFWLAAFTATPGLIPMAPERYYGVIPSLEAWR